MIAAILVCCGIAYQLLTILAALHFRKRLPQPDYQPAVSILKPVRGLDPDFYQAIRSHAVQQYPRFEILFGVADPDDPVRGAIERLCREFPHLPIRIVETRNGAPNQKVGSLAILARAASHDVMLVNDGDIVVQPDYLSRVIGLLADDRTGLVTCLYRGHGNSVPAKSEALGIATEFVPGVLVARLFSSVDFALGSTMAFRRRELDAAGGFGAIVDYLADDYQLGARIAALGKRVVLSDYVVETKLGSGNWREIWKHQVRWSRSIRVSRPAGYLGYAITHTTFWCLLAAMSGHVRIAAAGLLARMIAAAFYTGSLWWVPLRDLFGFAVWCAGTAGSTVEWRGGRYRLSRDGRIARIT